MSATVNIQQKELPVLTIEGGDEPYSIPLGGSIPPKRLEGLKDLDGMLDFLKEYIPAEVVDAYTLDQVTQIFSVWSEETRKESGATPGELLASHGSSKKTARR